MSVAIEVADSQLDISVADATVPEYDPASRSLFYWSANESVCLILVLKEKRFPATLQVYRSFRRESDTISPFGPELELVSHRKEKRERRLRAACSPDRRHVAVTVTTTTTFKKARRTAKSPRDYDSQHWLLSQHDDGSVSVREIVFHPNQPAKHFANLQFRSDILLICAQNVQGDEMDERTTLFAFDHRRHVFQQDTPFSVKAAHFVGNRWISTRFFDETHIVLAERLKSKHALKIFAIQGHCLTFAAYSREPISLLWRDKSLLLAYFAWEDQIRLFDYITGTPLSTLKCTSDMPTKADHLKVYIIDEKDHGYFGKLILVYEPPGSATVKYQFYDMATGELIGLSGVLFEHSRVAMVYRVGPCEFEALNDDFSKPAELSGAILPVSPTPWHAVTFNRKEIMSGMPNSKPHKTRRFTCIESKAFDDSTSLCGKTFNIAYGSHPKDLIEVKNDGSSPMIILTQSNGSVIIVGTRQVVIGAHDSYKGQRSEASRFTVWRYTTRCVIRSFDLHFAENFRCFCMQIKSDQEEIEIPISDYLSHGNCSSTGQGSEMRIEYSSPNIVYCIIAGDLDRYGGLNLSDGVSRIQHRLHYHVNYVRLLQTGRLLPIYLNDGISFLDYVLKVESLNLVQQYVAYCTKSQSVNTLHTIIRHLPTIITKYPSLAKLLFNSTAHWLVEDGTYEMLLAKFALHKVRDLSLAYGGCLVGRFDEVYAFSVDRQVVGRSAWDFIPTEYFWRRNKERYGKLFIIPFRDICRYPDMPTLRPPKDFYQPWRYYARWLRHHIVLPHSARSTYLQIIMLEDQALLDSGIFTTLTFEALNSYKWHTFARERFYIIWFIHLLYYTLVWSLGASPINTEPILYIIVVIAIVFLIQEFRQTVGEGLQRYLSFYNLIDIATYVLPLSISIQALYGLRVDNGNPITPALYSASILVLWLHFLITLRTFRRMKMAVLIDSISRIISSLIGFWIVIITITFAFAQALWIMSVDNLPLFNNFNSTSTDNSSPDLATVYLNVWFFLTGNYGNGGPEYNVLTFIFLVSVGIILMNVLIALMNDVVSKSNVNEDTLWVMQRARIIAEIELYWMLDRERKSIASFPRDIYYIADVQKPAIAGSVPGLMSIRDDYVPSQSNSVYTDEP
ncbi:hypothetical protein BZG36_00538 [Bifiguratus adelaidae]|uniref:Ion transport domain-containing protein n=1 Tax=Bifiguratus adelaidae TaxID=1938954 RepID=A0A261Y7M3_9FUNG|nr:hypothetical protein BZG36_00538 [Bifiguratus adelaidae]